MKNKDTAIIKFLSTCFIVFFLISSIAYAQDSKTEKLKEEIKNQIDGKMKDAQVMVDKVFSFAELGFQEVETSKYLTDILEAEGFGSH